MFFGISIFNHEGAQRISRSITKVESEMDHAVKSMLAFQIDYSVFILKSQIKYTKKGR